MTFLNLSYRCFLSPSLLFSSFTPVYSTASEDRTVESLLTAVNEHLKKVDQMANVELYHIAPQAIRCSLKDLVPYDLVWLS